MTFEESLYKGKKSCYKVQKSKIRLRGISILRAVFFESVAATCPLEMKDLKVLESHHHTPALKLLPSPSTS